jgi:hypothetical protein
MARTMSPAEITAKWQQRTSAAVEDMKKGVLAVQTAPGEQAAAAAQKALTNYTESITSGRFARRVRSVTLEQWKAAMVDKGANRVASGVQAATQKANSFWTEFLPHLQSVQSQVNSMPNTSLEDSIQRAVANMRGLAKFKRGGGGA